MTTHAGRETAVIIPFPQRRRPAGNRRDEALAAAEAALPRIAHAALGSGWYHEAAVQEAVDRARRR